MFPLFPNQLITNSQVLPRSIAAKRCHPHTPNAAQTKKSIDMTRQQSMRYHSLVSCELVGPGEASPVRAIWQVAFVRSAVLVEMSPGGRDDQSGEELDTGVRLT